MYPSGKWRTARKKESRCCNWYAKNQDNMPYCITPDIKIGDKYYDTMELGSRPFATNKLCINCANKENIK
jgi:hypothetical protein